MKQTTKFEPSKDGDFVNKTYLDTNLSKIEVHVSFIENEYNGFSLPGGKYSVEEILIERTVKTTKQKLHDKRFFDN